jgi:hypothetical protein
MNDDLSVLSLDQLKEKLALLRHFNIRGQLGGRLAEVAAEIDRRSQKQFDGRRTIPFL